MKKRSQGPSLYFASDKNIFDALNQRKVDSATVTKLFEDRNIIVSPKTPREELARYFARLNHDFEDHQSIAARLGVAARRERITSMEVVGISDADALVLAIQNIKKGREEEGDVIQITREGNNFALTFQYTTIDYGRNEFSQVQTRDGIVELLESGSGYTIRCTQNDYVLSVRDILLASVEKAAAQPLTKTVVSLFDVPDAKLRSQFFDRLMNDLPDYKRLDVIAAYVYKPKPEGDKNLDEAEDNEPDTHVEKVTMKGVGVTRSEVFNQLLKDEQYYITKVVWTSSKVLSAGAIYEIEATFEDPKDCTGFSFILSGVFPVEGGKPTSRKRAPQSSEIDEISRAIDAHSRHVMSVIKLEAKK